MASLESPSGVSLVHEPDATAVGAFSARFVAEQLDEKPNASIVFPTGNTPLLMYQALRHQPELRWGHSRLFHLDEYVKPPHAKAPLAYETYEEYMRRELWDYIDGRKHYFAHYTHNPDAYEALVTANGGPDLVILGIGKNGHIAFNEPGSPPDSPSRLIALTETTLRSNFGQVGHPGYPTQAVTLGLRAILGARRILLLATGSGKQPILQQAFDTNVPPSIDCPASWLKRHPNVTVVTDFVL